MAIESVVVAAAGKAVTAEIVKGLFNKIINPLLNKTLKDYFDKTELRIFSDSLESYLKKLEDKCSNVNTIAFGNSIKKLEDIYEPLTLSGEIGTREIKVDFKANIFTKNKKILLIDRAGMGKTTLSKRVVLNEIIRQKEIPIFVELRQLKDQDIKKYIKSLLGVNEKISDSFFEKLPFIYIFDGIDEISSPIKNDLIKTISSFILELNDSKALITSRHESDLSLLSNMSIYNINPLNEAEAISLIKRYDEKDEISESLIKEIEVNRNSIGSFLSTPLYVSLLFCAYRHKTSIPKKNHMFYNQVYDALFETHDLSKQTNFVREKHSKLDSQDFHKILRGFGFNCLANNGKLEYQTDELGIEIKTVIDEINDIKVSASDFIKDMTETVPLFIKEGSTIRWSHKSLMEYFAAMFICCDAKIKHKEIMLYFYNHENWRTYTNLLELCADIDYSTFRESIIKLTLEEYFEYKENSYQNIVNKKIKPEDILKRQYLTFSGRFFCSIIPEDQRHKTIRKIHLADPFGDIEEMFNESDLSADSIVSTFAEGKELEIAIFNTRAMIPIKVLRVKKNMQVASEHTITQFGFIKTKKIIETIVEDDPKNVLNNSINFSIVNKALESMSYNWIPDDLAQSELDAIKREMKNSSKDLMAKLKGLSKK